jgi:hypothetical protein
MQSFLKAKTSAENAIAEQRIERILSCYNYVN